MAKEPITISIRDTKEYDDAINEIGEIINKYKLTFVEAFGILESVKNELYIQSLDFDDGDES